MDQSTLQTAPQGEQTEREAFEAWASEGGKWPKAVERESIGNYKLQQTSSAWRTWQAAWQARASMHAQAPLPAEGDVALLKLARFGAAMLRAHRGYCAGEIGDIDACTAQDAAIKCGVLEAITVTAPCGESCECVGLFPTDCCFVPDAVGRLRRSFEGGER